MLRISALALVAFVVAACSATNPSPGAKSAGREECSRWEGQECVRDTQCCTLWCVNHECARRDD